VIRGRWPKFTAAAAAELWEKGFRISIYRPDEDELRLSLLLQTTEARGPETITMEQECSRSRSQVCNIPNAIV